MYRIKKAIDIFKQEGFVSLVKKMKRKLFGKHDFQRQLNFAKKRGDFDVSIIIPVFNAVDYSKACI